MAGKATRGGIMSSRIKSANVKIFPEAGLGYFVGPFFALIPNGIINVFLTQYWVYVLGIDEWAANFTWIVPLVSSILVVVGNLLVGRLMEGKPKKAGKARPLLVLSLPFLAVAIVMLFLAPSPYNSAGIFNESVTMWTLIVCAVGYNLFYAIAWPIYFTSHSAMVNLSTRNASQRSLLGTLAMAGQVGAAGVAGMAGGVLADLLGLVPTTQNVASELVKNSDFIYKVFHTQAEYEAATQEAINAFANTLPRTAENMATLNNAAVHGGSWFGGANSWFNNLDMSLNSARASANERWFVIMIVMIACTILGVFIEFLFTRERITEESFAIEMGEVKGEDKAEKKAAGPKKPKMGEQVKVCFHDKYWWIIIVFFFLYQLGGMLKNNGQTFYSQAWTGGLTLSSLIGTLGAIPTAAGMVIIWPLANKFGKAATIKWGAALAVLFGLVGWVPLFMHTSDSGLITTFSVLGFCLKALGTVPAMYVSLALMSDVLDHQEAVYGVRTDGFTMAIYGSIMIAMTGISNAIILAINGMFTLGSWEHRTALTGIFFGGEMLCYIIIFVILLFMNVEKFTDLDHAAIEAAQKAEAEKAGIEYVPAKIRLELEQKKAEEEAREASIAELRARCEKSGQNFDEELKKFEAAEAEKAEKAAKKKADGEAKKAAKEAAAKEKEEAREAALTPEQKEARAKSAEAKKAKKNKEAAELAEKHAEMVAKGHQVLAR